MLADGLGREELMAVRERLMVLHKELLQRERARYEEQNGPIRSNGEYLQLLINDPWFAGVQPMTKLIVAIDEAMDGKEVVGAVAVEELLVEARRMTVVGG